MIHEMIHQLALGGSLWPFVVPVVVMLAPGVALAIHECLVGTLVYLPLAGTAGDNKFALAPQHLEDDNA